MLPVFVHPLAFFGLLALPALVAIYWLRNRHRRHVVSSLLLWDDPRKARDGGTRIRRLQTPLVFFLELLLLLLLVLAAVGPYVPSARSARPLVVVLDDSFSMLAGGDDSARSRAITALREEIRGRGNPAVRFVLAGERPTLLGEPVQTEAEVADLLERWHCRSASASLEEGLALAAEVGGELALLLVVTDQKPEREPQKGRVQWWAFGEPRENVAIVNAARTNRDGSERCFLEVANFSGRSRSTTLILTTGETVERLLDLGPGASRRVVLSLGSDAPALSARIEDGRGIDQRIDLVPVPNRRVRVDVRVGAAVLRALVEKALRATDATLQAVRPDLIITDASEAVEEVSEAWMVRLLAEKEAEAFVGPFVLDRSHPLTEGLSLGGVIWGSGKSSLPGSPVIMAGNVPLLTDSTVGPGRHLLRLRLRPDLSTLQDSPNWPILIANLVQWHAAQQPGLARPNIRLGEQAILSFDEAPGSVRLLEPDGSERRVRVQNSRAVVRPEQVGVHQFRTGGKVVPFACNALTREESDLRGCVSGRWGDWLDETSLRLEYRSIAWLLLLLALGVATLHVALVARGSAGRNV